MDYAKRAAEIAATDYVARASGCLLHWGSCRYLLGKSCNCDRREDVESVADALRGFDMVHLAELQAAHDAGVAEGKAGERALEMFVVRSLAHEVKNGDDKTAEELIVMLLAERDKARASYAFMVQRAADGASGNPPLSGYREMGETASKAELGREEARAEVATLRQIISDAAREVGAQVSPECSLEFMALLPREIALALRRAEGGR